MINRANQFIVFAALTVGICNLSVAQSVDITATYKLYDQGKYQECIAACEKGIQNAWRVDWRILKINSEIRLGKYQTALQSAKAAMENHTGDIRVRWAARHAYLLNNDLDNAELMLRQINQLVKNAAWRYSDAEDHIVLGKIMLDANADAKKVLELFFDTARKVRPDLVDNYIVSADLALSKSDFDLAVKESQAGLKRHPEHAELYFRLARGLWDSDREKAVAALSKTLELNPTHFDALLFQADHAIDGEAHESAKKLIQRVLQVNPKHELAFAYLAIISHLEGDFEQEKKYRSQALSSWSKNPQVDFVIGRKLSQKYRFKEAAEYQRRALEFRPDFVPAKIQLAQDLLRLGKDEEGWALVAEANQLDAYNILMHNLQTLHDEISQYTSLKKDGIIVRMSEKEAKLYGPEVLKLLVDAKKMMTKKYDHEFTKPVIVEIFPRQEDFAIRTFGMPGGVGFLGVCFGHLITANSPASQGDSPTNWESVLWHEFCHAVTLGKTNNRMPRWLSEGISVYEERLRNSGSGERMTPAYRKMILSDDLTPVSQLSAAFLQAKSPAHLQFAYFESSLVVEYLIQEYGLDTLKKILVDLGAGIPINETLQRYTGSLAELDQKFKTYATTFAETYASELDFSESDLEPTSSIGQIKAFIEKSPNNFSANLQLAATLIRERDFAGAEKVLQQLSDKFKDSRVHPVVLELLANVYKEQKESQKEIEVLEKTAELTDDRLEVYRRLSAAYVAAKEWEKLKVSSRRILAVNPLQVEPHRQLAIAGEKLNDYETTSRALECLLEFDTTDVALTHYRIAGIRLAQKKIDLAKRHVLLALEEAPRYRDAMRLLLKIKSLENASGNAQPSNASQ